MTTLIRRFQLPIALASGFMVTGCATMDLNPGALAGLPGDLLSLPGAVGNLGRRPTSAYDVMSKVGTTLAIIATVQKYAALTSVQRHRVEQVVTRKYDG